ncbi:hypothetical protein [Luteimonas salinilitoris]|uniref:Uncharacterized protein n=1 Tax=Luteimonas salinilitoris TaxID=3237697 RepID=A0ABV4HQP9_9GAMM
MIQASEAWIITDLSTKLVATLAASPASATSGIVLGSAKLGVSTGRGALQSIGLE